MTPADIKDVVEEAEHRCGKKRKDGREVESELKKCKQASLENITSDLLLDAGKLGYQRIPRVYH